jgi:hypothetical protein
MAGARLRSEVVSQFKSYLNVFPTPQQSVLRGLFLYATGLHDGWLSKSQRTSHSAWTRSFNFPLISVPRSKQHRKNPWLARPLLSAKFPLLNLAVSFCVSL